MAMLHTAVPPNMMHKNREHNHKCVHSLHFSHQLVTNTYEYIPDRVFILNKAVTYKLFTWMEIIQVNALPSELMTQVKTPKHRSKNLLSSL